MNVPPKLRIPLIALLAIVGIQALLDGFRYGSFLLYSMQSLNSLSPLLGSAGGFAILLFVTAVIRSLSKKERISKEAYVISLIFGAISLVFLLLFGNGLLKDMFGIYCSGFFGSKASCTLTPLLLLAVYVLNPITLAIAGIASIYGTITLRNQSQKSAKKS